MPRFGRIFAIATLLAAGWMSAASGEDALRARVVGVSPVSHQLVAPSNPAVGYPETGAPTLFGATSHIAVSAVDPKPETDPSEVETHATWIRPCFDPTAFCPDPVYDHLPYDGNLAQSVYEGKQCVPTQRPWLELGRGLYRFGELPPASPLPFGPRNLTIPHFLVYGDYRTALATVDDGPGPENVIWAHRLNLDFDYKLTATERFHAFWGPLDQAGQFTRAQFDGNDIELIAELDDQFDTFFFEGDLGYIWGGMTDQYAPFDMPFSVGKLPLLFQNGIWMVDAIEGFAFTPFMARNSSLLNISNYDITFFFAFDDVESPAFGALDKVANIYGMNSFIESLGGYFEIGYAFLDDTTGQGLGYHNIGFAFTRRYFELISNSVRVITNAGQQPVGGVETADGVAILLENALVSSNPNFLVPYCNLFAGFGTPQSVARAAGTGGMLVNTGINFETDGLTGYPTLDDTANNTCGGAMGVNLLGPDWSWQYIVELAMVHTFDDPTFRRAVDDQYAIGTRYQLPLNNAWLVRFDTIYGFLENADDLLGARAELRWKF